ncbi:hypothetical protein [Shewanella sp. T24-MNA-CIBAN-0130]|uniref:hypothetical protein n=1 Tax=Shewanella sp. T24-MNA-CIBAN-0130 TaxID=3140470 RepID=UPI00331B4F60
MIEQHYSHVVPKMFTRELSGVEIRKSKPKKTTSTPAALAKSNAMQCNARLAKQLKEWGLEFKARGCI